MSLTTIVPGDNYSLFLATIIHSFLYKWHFAMRTVLRMTTIKGTEEHGVLQMILRMIWPPPCFSVPLQMFVCKEDGSLDDQNQGDGGARIVPNDYPDDPAPSCSSVPLQMDICKGDGWSKTFWSDGAEIRTGYAASIEDPQYKKSYQTDQCSGVRAKWPMNINVEVRWWISLPVRWKISRVT